MSQHPQLAEIGKRIRRVRKAKGLSQDLFAIDIGMARSYYGGVERGERNLSTLKLVQIALALGVEVGALFPDAKDLRRLGKQAVTSLPIS